jgi:uncharacterized protein YjbI with pentapeptide repeats
MRLGSIPAPGCPIPTRLAPAVTCGKEYALNQKREDKLCIDNADLGGISLRGFIIRDVYFASGNLETADFNGAHLYNVEFEGVMLSDAVFANAELDDILFYDVQAYGIIFRNSKLTRTRFQGSNLSTSIFQNVKMFDVSFESDNIDHSTSINGASFLESDMAALRFAGATYDHQTKFPPGFVPRKVKGLSETG